MAAFHKCLVPSQLVSVGQEGYWGASSPERWPSLPGAWALCFGGDYALTLQQPGVDYGTAHAYEAMRGAWVSC